MSCSRKALKKVSADRAAFLDRACDGKGNMMRRFVGVYTAHRSSQSADCHLRRPGDRVGCGCRVSPACPPHPPMALGASIEKSEGKPSTVASMKMKTTFSKFVLLTAPETRGAKENCASHFRSDNLPATWNSNPYFEMRELYFG